MSSTYNPGLGPNGIPNESYQQRLERNNSSNTNNTTTNSNHTTIARNLGYNRPSQHPTAVPPPHIPHPTLQSNSYSPYYPSAPTIGPGPDSVTGAPLSTNPNSLYPPAYHYQNPVPYPSHHPQYPPTGSHNPAPNPVHPPSLPVQYQPQYQPAPPQQFAPDRQFSPFNNNPLAPPPQGASNVPSHQNPAMPSYFRPSGRRKALLVGINYRGTSAELRGCVRDVSFVHHLLTTKFGFKNSEFVVLTDEADGISGVRRGAPTRRTILSSLNWLVSDTRPGDSLWFSFSGHGSQVRDLDGDEDDGYDETILPVDYKKNGQIVDDELYAIVRRICRGARLTVLLDACHSGTGLDLPYQHDVFGTGSGQRISGTGRPSLAQGIMGVAGALLNGNPSGALSAGLSLATGGRKKKPQAGPDPNAGEVLLFSGCKDNQTSADTSKLSGGLTTGAMTYALIETLEHSTVGDWRNYTYRKLLQTMRQKLRANRMTQTPQFSTSHPFDLGSPFVI